MVCSKKNRWGAPTERLKKGKTKVLQILKDEKYMRFLNSKAKKISFKYNVDYEDCLSNHFLELLEGHNVFLEQSAMGFIRKEYNRGLVGKRKCGDVWAPEELLQNVQMQKKAKDVFGFIEYLYDLSKMVTEVEYQLICMYLSGFDKGEIADKTKAMSRRDFYDFWERVGLSKRN